ncbi:unnamed protein product [Protopolystoma xenopodis]|uniref:Uncharacterized protein n=1 Tax=Protopolystoma xenopodis TaxID=117903 RepID=A0A3S5C3X2_9PLAT|nr:unnamed protein product [Protopolystoma xenopodis]
MTSVSVAIIRQISELPTCQCNELVDEVLPIKSDTVEKQKSSTDGQLQQQVTRQRTKLELAVQSALEAAKDVLRPPTPPPPPPIPPPPPRHVIFEGHLSYISS